MHIIHRIIIIVFLLSIHSCRKYNPLSDSEYHSSISYDVILVIGQSNTHQGLGFDFQLDAPDDRVKQLGRWGLNTYKIIPATEPLEHFSVVPNCIGFPMTFSKLYANQLLDSGRHVLIIPASKGSTSFSANDWNVGDVLYSDAIARTNYILNNYPSKLVAILWHQGESDVGYPLYQQKLDTMITQIRKDIVGNHTNVPFILGGMVPYWVDQDATRIAHNNIISGTVNRISETGYADPRVPFTIVKPDNTVISVHFDANGQREMGIRYFDEYMTLR